MENTGGPSGPNGAGPTLIPENGIGMRTREYWLDGLAMKGQHAIDLNAETPRGSYLGFGTIKPDDLHVESEACWRNHAATVAPELYGSRLARHWVSHDHSGTTYAVGLVIQ